MKNFKQRLALAGIICFALALFQVVIGFSPSLSLYFGAPEALVKNIVALIVASLFIAGVLVVFGLYALSGAGSIRKLPFLKQGLVGISCVFIIRGLLLLPEFLVVVGVFHVSIPVAPRFILFSLGSLFIGIIFIAGIIDGWSSLS
ncbi:MAG: hypothetical protein KKC20_18295 [Proteobacteria bacterium]|nr:hypothetical protein [Pseudomonadota bacterium]